MACALVLSITLYSLAINNITFATDDSRWIVIQAVAGSAGALLVGALLWSRVPMGGRVVLGLCGVAIGVYAGLDHTAPRLLATPMLVLGVAAAIGGLALAGRRVGRTTYRPDPWRWPELVVMLSGLGTAVVAWWVSGHQLVVAYPDLASFPQVTLVALLGSVLGLVAAAAAPEPRVAAS